MKELHKLRTYVTPHCFLCGWKHSTRIRRNVDTVFIPKTPPAVFTFYGYYDSLRRACREQLASVGALPACSCDCPWRFTNEGQVRLNQFPNCHEWNLHAQTRSLRCDPLGPYISSWCTRTCLLSIDFLVTRLRNERRGDEFIIPRCTVYCIFMWRISRRW